MFSKKKSNGNNTLFWTSCWLHGCSIGELAPKQVCGPVFKKKKQAHCVAQAWENNTWMNDIQGA